MATEILAAGTTAAVSSEFTIATGERVTLTLKPASGKRQAPIKAVVEIQIATSAGAWVQHEYLHAGQTAAVIDAVGTFRCRRAAQAEAVGVDSAT